MVEASSTLGIFKNKLEEMEYSIQGALFLSKIALIKDEFKTEITEKLENLKNTL